MTPVAQGFMLAALWLSAFAIFAVNGGCRWAGIIYWVGAALSIVAMIGAQVRA